MEENPKSGDYIDDEHLRYILEELGCFTNDLIEEKIYETRDDAETRRRWAELLDLYRHD